MWHFLFSDRGVPNPIRITSSRINLITPNEVSDANEAKELHEQVYNGHITEEKTFEENPLEQNEDFKVGKRLRSVQIWCFNALFNDYKW